MLCRAVRDREARREVDAFGRWKFDSITRLAGRPVVSLDGDDGDGWLDQALWHDGFPADDVSLSPPPPWATSTSLGDDFDSSDDGAGADTDTSADDDEAILRALGEAQESAAAAAPDWAASSAAEAAPPACPSRPGRPRWRGPGVEPRWHRAWADRKEMEALATPDSAYLSADDDFGKAAERRASVFAGLGPT